MQEYSFKILKRNIVNSILFKNTYQTLYIYTKSMGHFVFCIYKTKFLCYTVYV